MPSAERLQVVWLDDVVATVEHILTKGLARQVIELAGPETYYYRIFMWWCAFGVPAFAAVAVIYWLMIAKPQIAFF
jgi:uncharacterized membrane protein